MLGRHSHTKLCISCKESSNNSIHLTLLSDIALQERQSLCYLPLTLSFIFQAKTCSLLVGWLFAGHLGARVYQLSDGCLPLGPDTRPLSADELPEAAGRLAAEGARTHPVRQADPHQGPERTEFQ